MKPKAPTPPTPLRSREQEICNDVSDEFNGISLIAAEFFEWPDSALKVTQFTWYYKELRILGENNDY